MKIVCDNHRASGMHYAPIAVGNGDLALQIDYEGVMRQRSYASEFKTATTPGIRRAGFRYDSSAHDLVPFGWFEQELSGSGEVRSWTQELDVEGGLVGTRCEYQNGMVVESEVFCHLERNVIALRKRIFGGGEVAFTFKHLFGNPRRMWLRYEGEQVFYNVDEGQCKGAIALWSDKLAQVGNGVLRGDAREFSLFLAFDEADIAWSRARSFDELKASHKAAWKAYWEESYISVPDKKLEEVYYVAQYHLRISSTKWSIPVRLHDSYWQGRYFGFDEYFAFRGLATSGHLAVAKKVPEFRHAILPVALQRASGYSPEVENGAALYSWETLEDGSEGAPAGMWLEHIFHMANSALGAYDYFLLSGDTPFLKGKGYPVIRACALFFDLMAADRRPDGSAIIGKCTDLERLGAARENAFMTTCGAIATLEAAVRAATLLGCDASLAARWRELAAKLKASLPRAGSKYVPYPGCPQKSVAVFSGLFPYPALQPDDPAMVRAVEDYIDNGARYGNMYPQGAGVCAWYAAWMAAYHARRGDGRRAYELLAKTATQTGCFSETFEIYEMAHHPWFTTAEGTFIQSVNELFVQVDQEGRTHLEPAIPPDWKDFAFKLQGAAGRKIEAGRHNGTFSEKELKP